MDVEDLEGVNKVRMPRSVCQLHADLLKTVAEIKEARRKADLTMGKIGAKILELLWGVISFVGDELIAAIAMVAMNLAASLLGAAAKSMQAALAKLIGALLKALLGSKDAIYAIAGMIRDSVVKSVDKEALLLNGAKYKVLQIESIIAKWMDRFDRSEYAGVIDRALPYIKKSRELFASVIDRLTDIEAEDIYFDQQKYDSAVRNLEIAIEVLHVETVVEKLLNPSDTIAQNSYELESAANAKTKKKFSGEYRAANREYKMEIASNPSGAASLISRQKLEYKVDSIDVQQQFEMSKNQGAASLKATGDYLKDGIVGAARSKASEFKNDIELLMELSGQIVKDLTMAKGINKMTQYGTKNLMHFESRMFSLINHLIELIKGLGGAAAKPVIKILETVEGMEDVAIDLLEEAKVSQRKFPSPVIHKINAARAVLMTSESLLGSVICNGLAKLINGSHDLKEEKKAYAEFIKRLDVIPDWDGEVSIWARSPERGAPSAYEHMLSQITSATMLASSNKFSRAKEEISGVKHNIRSALSHNRIVKQALTSWVAPRSDAVDELKKVLEKLGLLKSLMLMASLFSLFKGFPILSMAFNGKELLSCPIGYPEMYEDETIAKELAKEGQNIPGGVNGSTTETAKAMDAVIDNTALASVKTTKILEEAEQSV